MPGDRVLTGVLRDIGHRVPTWVRPPHPRYRFVDPVYIRFPTGRGLAADMNETVHSENDFTVHGFRCYIPLPNNVILTATLEPYNYDRHFFSSPRVFVRLPFQNGVIYTGMIRRGYSFSDNMIH